MHRRSLKKRRCLWLKEKKFLGIFQTSVTINHVKFWEGLELNNLGSYQVKSRSPFKLKGPNIVIYPLMDIDLEKFVIQLINFQNISKLPFLGLSTNTEIYSPVLLKSCLPPSHFIASLWEFHFLLLFLSSIKQKV
jgi:hypothetical protein